MNNNEPLIKAENVSKKFCKSLKKSLWYGVKDSYSEVSGQHKNSHKLRKQEFWALNDVSFELRRGECLGLIGENGAGKSTLLKLLNGLIKPDTGKIEIRGRVDALIELGAGFNPVLSGYENIYINGAVLGFTKKDIDKRLDSIIEFAEISEFLDMPVQNYSSGMYVRLGFAIAAHLQPDILLIDEVLAVGDIGFRAKCYTKISEMLKNCAVIFVSHQLPQISKLCDKVMVLNKSHNIFSGNTQEGIEKYNNLFADKETVISGTGEATVKNIKLLDEKGNETDTFNYYSPLTISFDTEVSAKYSQYVVSLTFMTKDTNNIAQCHSQYNNITLTNNNRQHTVIIDIEHVLLNPGKYYLNIIIFDTDNIKHLSWLFAAKKINISDSFRGGAPVQFIAKWQQIT